VFASGDKGFLNLVELGSALLEYCSSVDFFRLDWVFLGGVSAAPLTSRPEGILQGEGEHLQGILARRACTEVASIRPP
jgi:hypothetical protein